MLAILPIFASLVIICRAEMEGYIIGGDFASINRYPHSAFLVVHCVVTNGNNTVWICGSSIINQRILLTAAHCVYRCGAGTRMTINMGDENRQNGLIRTASGFIMHERYVQFTNDCDIALIKMKTPVEFSENIRRVALLKQPPYEEPASLAGWGLINEVTHKGGLNLKEVDQKVWKRAACVQMFGYMPRGTICASSKTLSNFAAQGDSGSALVVRGYIQIGLVSYKNPSRADNVIVYTDVGYYYDWISLNAHKLYCFYNPKD